MTADNTPARAPIAEASQIEPPEVAEVASPHIACDGGTHGHPRVWLQIDPAIGWVECGYCDKRYVLKAGAGGH